MTEPFFQDDGSAIYVGDCREVLKQLPEASVNCIVTSPPYFALRDYQTGSWEGGDPSCDHVLYRGAQGKNGQRAGRTFTAKPVYKSACGRCGAKRIDLQVGLEESPAEYVAELVGIFRECRRALRDDGTLWLNLGDSYVSGGRGGSGGFADDCRGWQNVPQQFGKKRGMDGLKNKDLIGIPWRAAFALQAEGWWLRSDVIWHKPSPTPESVRDRPTRAHEYIFLLSKSEDYFYDFDAIKEKASGVGGGACFGKRNLAEAAKASGQGTRDYERPDYADRNKRSVWTVPNIGFAGAHFATFPEDLIRPCILAGCPVGGTVLDPFFGSGTVGAVAKPGGRNYLGIELNEEYAEMAKQRLSQGVLFEASAP